MATSSAVFDEVAILRRHLHEQGFAFQPAAQVREWMGIAVDGEDWHRFQASWNDLEVDTYLLQKGRFRRRRHAVLRFDVGNGFVHQPQQPHFQSEHYNALQGGIQRWFSPIKPEILRNPCLLAVLNAAVSIFVGDASAPSAAHRVELHQFRIEPLAGQEGQPTPEGMHRDGVDHVLVLMIHRHNIASGTTLIGGLDGGFRSSFTLAESLDTAWVDDHRVAHAVTAVTPLDAAQPAYRDVLVVTFKRE